MSRQNPNDSKISFEIILIDSVIEILRQNPEAGHLSTEQVFDVFTRDTQKLVDKLSIAIEKMIPSWFENPDDPRITELMQYSYSVINNIATTSKIDLIDIIEDRLRKNN